ncbi:MAG TPA: ATP-dependent Clp protease adaptor ClpS [Bradyrhizobium sp.]|jgi:ATP-dependent Clp protease adapter protein ClpS|nr:ATP-dependent Clp protease adaptor ClpS [Bradyrhizobium sp.]
MSDVQAEFGHLEVIFHNDDKTPLEFVIELLHSVFKKQLVDALRFTEAIKNHGQASCGTYPRDIASDLLEAGRERIRAAGHPLRITSKAVAGGDELAGGRCKLCGALFSETRLSLKGMVTLICDGCLYEVTSSLPDAVSNKQFDYACEALDWHFAGIARDQLISTSRQFPGHMRADIQAAIDRLLSVSPIRFFGIHEEYRYETLSLAALSRGGRNAKAIAPAQYHDVDVGESAPMRCLNNGLWLCRTDELRYAVVLSTHREYAYEPATRIEIAVPTGADGAEFVQRAFAELEHAVNVARCYRGKILSLDADGDYRGRARGVMVHKLPPVQREDVVLPEATLKLLDRNVLSFVGSRPQLRRLGQSTRKGVLLYGPPGTGKTHTIRYLASNLPGHTTLIITAAQVAMLAQYMSLARLLQPTMVVIEDVDLIARDRTEMGPCEESMLNGLLNEMDGLKQDADILFVLTTNRPEELEGALASRPGRIDQAIEVPLPDDIGRKKLVQLYGRGLPLGETIVDEAARRTKGVSAAFIKELMRRIAQASIARDGGTTVESNDIGEALDDMLFAGGRLNVKLLGGAREMASG